MIAGRLREYLRILRWEAADVAQELDCPRNDVVRWLEGRAPVPLPVAAWFEALVKAHKGLPPPDLSPPNFAENAKSPGPVVVSAFAAGIPPKPFV